MPMNPRLVAWTLGAALFGCAAFDNGTGAGGGSGGSTSPGSTGSHHNPAGTGGGVAACTPGETHDCYTGPENTRDVGLCKPGTQVCDSDGHYGACKGQVLPKEENCNHRGDEDCNGEACSDAIWQKATGDAQMQVIGAVAIDDDGNTYAAGYFVGTINLGGGSTTSSGAAGMFLAKFDSTGKKLWEDDFSAGGNPNASIGSIAVNTGGDVAIAGTSQGASLSFPPTNIAAPAHHIGFVGLYGADGTQKFVKAISGSGDVNAAAVLLDDSDHVFVGGKFAGNLTCTTGGCPSAASGTMAYARELDMTGAESWTKSYGSSTSAAITSMALRTDGKMLLAGTFGGSNNLAGKTLMSNGGADVFVVQIAASGTANWAIGFGSSGDDTAVLALRRQDSSFVVGGAAAGEVAIGMVTTGPTNGGYLFSFDDQGHPQWAQSYGNDGASAVLSIGAAYQGDVFVAGVVGQGKANFGGGPIKNMEAATDCALTHLDGDGNVRWSKKFEGSGAQDLVRIASNSDGYTAFSVGYQNTIDFGLGPNTSSNSDGDSNLDIALVTFQP
jgi:hypothetical protein